MNDQYNEAKAGHGLVTRLPFSPGKEMKAADADRLRLYLKNERSREMYWDKIQEMIRRDPALEEIYHQEMGRVNARIYRKRLKESGIVDAWFGVLHGNIVAAGKTRVHAERVVKDIVPPDKRKFVHLFEVKAN